jgi:hypothetical protein
MTRRLFLVFALLSAIGCGRPIELVDEGVVEISVEAPFDLAFAPDDLRASAELPGVAAPVTLRLEGESFVGTLPFVVEDDTDTELIVRFTGAGVLLARAREAITVEPRAQLERAPSDFQTADADGPEEVLFDVNRNARTNIDDLLAGCAPGVPAATLGVSATDLQFASGVEPGEFARQVVVLDNLSGDELDYRARVVGAPGVNISLLEVDAQAQPQPRPELGAAEPLSLEAGGEALLAVTFTPVDSRLTTGFLIIEAVDTCDVEVARAVRLIGNPEGDFALAPAGFDPTELDPVVDDLDLPLPVDTGASRKLFDGEQVRVDGLPAADDAAELGGLRVRAVSLVRVPAGTALGVALVDLEQDADLAVFPVDGAALGAPILSVHPGTDVESLSLPSDLEERDLLVAVIEAQATEGALPSERFSLFFRAFSIPSFAEPAIAPALGPVGGGTPVTLFGAGFKGGARVFFSGAEASAVDVNDAGTQITAVTPPGTLRVELNPATLVVQNPPEGGEPLVATLPEAFVYAPAAPEIIQLSPESTAVNNTALVEIRGAGFTDFFGPIEVDFGDQPGTNVQLVSATQLLVTSPANAALESVAVTVRLQAPGGPVETTLPTAFSWITALDDPPTTAAISPTSGPENAANVVTVTGADFADGARVLFGGVPAASVTFVDPGELTAVTPLLPVGDHAVLVENPDGQAANSAPTFTAVPVVGVADPQLFAAQVVAGQAVEGQAFSVLLTGANLAPAQLVSVRFDGPETLTVTPAARADTAVRVDVASLLQGTYDVTLVYPDAVEVALAGALVVEGDCGDGVKALNEECDQLDVGGETCLGLGFVGGALACNGDCTLNTALCDGCGNGVLDDGEQCDDPAFGGQTCASLGFTDGDLACNGNCTLDQSGCSTCGDGIVGAGEVCDGVNVNNETCVTLGFADGGQLGCVAGCGAFDISACEECGDGICSGSEDVASCSADCLATCNDGNDTCDAGETCANCPGDCNVCDPLVAVLSGGGQTVPIGTSLTQPITVRVEDSNGTPVPGVQITFTHPPGGRTLGTETLTSSLTDSTGTASAVVTLGFGVGAQSITVSGLGPDGGAIQGLPATLDFTAEDVPSGTIFTIYNASGTNNFNLDPSTSRATAMSTSTVKASPRPSAASATAAPSSPPPTARAASTRCPSP